MDKRVAKTLIVLSGVGMCLARPSLRDEVAVVARRMLHGRGDDI